MSLKLKVRETTRGQILVAVEKDNQTVAAWEGPHARAALEQVDCHTYQGLTKSDCLLIDALTEAAGVILFDPADQWKRLPLTLHSGQGITP